MTTSPLGDYTRAANAATADTPPTLVVRRRFARTRAVETKLRLWHVSAVAMETFQFGIHRPNMAFKPRAQDLIVVTVLAILSCAAGLVVNHFSARPLALAYRSPAQRLQAELTELVAGPPMQSFPVATVGLDEFRQIVDSRSALILDARAPLYYRQGHVPGALNLSREDFGAEYLRLRGMLDRDKDRPIIVYCSGGSCHDSKMVAEALTTLGYTRVRIFPGGWEAWSSAGMPAQRG
jgi:rhodanese-related sulfurtransferase